MHAGSFFERRVPTTAKTPALKRAVRRWDHLHVTITPVRKAEHYTHYLSVAQVNG